MKDRQTQFTENIWTWKHSFMHLPIEICSSTSKTLIIFFIFLKFSKALGFNTYQGFLFFFFVFFFFFFFFLYAVIPVHFNEFINKIMKWNIANIKNRNYEVLNLQVHLTRLALTHEKKEKMIFTRRMPFFLLLLPENKFLQKVWTINAQVNE